MLTTECLSIVKLLHAGCTFTTVLQAGAGVVTTDSDTAASTAPLLAANTHTFAMAVSKLKRGLPKRLKCAAVISQPCLRYLFKQKDSGDCNQ